jgi:nitrogen fixation protein FixH
MSSQSGSSSMQSSDKRKSGTTWVRSVIVVYSIFALATTGFVVFSFSQKVELVSDNYYQQEVEYQQRIEQVRRTQALHESIVWSLRADRQALDIMYPQGLLRGATLSGTIHLYRPSASQMDKIVVMQPNENGLQSLDISGLAKGYWKVRIEWKSGTESYFQEQDLVL